jgi:hypothetical protein
MKRWPIIRHVRYFYVKWQMIRHYDAWQSLGFGYFGWNKSDIDGLNEIWRGER